MIRLIVRKGAGRVLMRVHGQVGGRNTSYRNTPIHRRHERTPSLPLSPLRPLMTTCTVELRRDG